MTKLKHIDLSLIYLLLDYKKSRDYTCLKTIYRVRLAYL